MLLEERGFLAGALLSHLQRQRRGDVIRPLKANRLATQEALQLAAMADRGESHPSRAAQSIALVRGVEHRGAKCAGPLNAWVMRCWNQTKKRPEQIGLVTTDLRLSALGTVRHYEERPEIEQDDEQLKSGGWQLPPEAQFHALERERLLGTDGGLARQSVSFVYQHPGGIALCQ